MNTGAPSIEPVVKFQVFGDSFFLADVILLGNGDPVLGYQRRCEQYERVLPPCKA